MRRDEMTDEERAIYDTTYAGAVDRLYREVQALKLAIYQALPYSVRWLFQWLKAS